MEEKMEMNIGDSKSNLFLENREKIESNGVIEVISFNEEEIVLNTKLGILKIEGEDLKMNKLDVHNGDISISGKINSCIYTSDKKSKNKESIFAKLFK
ncbi:sporulation protein YabP [Clostridium tepidiprofundi]|nr:sporulation protein YabP [Clostridium tepidiprofundi]